MIVQQQRPINRIMAMGNSVSNQKPPPGILLKEGFTIFSSRTNAMLHDSKIWNLVAAIAAIGCSSPGMLSSIISLISYQYIRRAWPQDDYL
jgi:hypothetical protein